MMEQIGKRIKYLRENERKITQEELAKDLNVGRETVARWENGTRDLKTDVIIQLSNYFGVTSDYLLGISDYKTAQAADIGTITGLSEDNVNWLKVFNVGCPERFNTVKNNFFSILNTLLNYLREENVIFSLMRLNLRARSFKKSFHKNVEQENTALDPSLVVHEAVRLHNEIQVIDNKKKEIENLISKVLSLIIGYNDQELNNFYDTLCSYHVYYDIDINDEDIIEHVDIERFIEQYQNKKEGDT